MLHKLSIKSMLSLSFIVITLGFMALASAFTTSIVSIKRQLSNYKDTLIKMELSKEIKVDIAGISGKIYETYTMNMGAQDSENVVPYQNIYDAIESLSKLYKTDKDTQIKLDSLKSDIADLWTKGKKMFASNKNDMATGMDLMEGYHQIENKILNKIQDIVNDLHNREMEINRHINSMLFQIFLILTTSAIVVISCIILISLFVIKNISRLLLNFTDILTTGTSGDFTISYQEEKDSKNELSKLGALFNKFLNRLNDNFLNIKKMAVDVEKSAGEIADSSLQLASSSEEQSRSSDSIYTIMNRFNISLEGITTNIEKQTEIIQDNAEFIKNLLSGINNMASNSLSIKGKIDDNINSINTGKEKILQAIDGSARINENMKNIGEKIYIVGKESENIDEILNVINGIASEINLLSMNAAIEAAHAGDYGKGFAIVASEVRNLADSSSESVNKITQLVEKIKKSVLEAISITEIGKIEANKGQVVSKEAGDSFEFIMENINNINRFLSEMNRVMDEQESSTNKVLINANELMEFSTEIKASTNEQSKRSKEILMSLSEFNSATAENSKSAGKLSDFSKKLNENSLFLLQMVLKFKLRELR